MWADSIEILRMDVFYQYLSPKTIFVFPGLFWVFLPKKMLVYAVKFYGKGTDACFESYGELGERVY